MTNYLQDLVVEEDREYAQRKSLHAPFEVSLRAVSIDAEVGNFTHYGNRSSSLNILHPYVSINSWIRTQPEGGTNYVATYRSDQASPQLLASTQRGANLRVAAFRDGNNLYRPLYPGEMELCSSGTAQLFLSRRPIAELRGGLITRWADQDKLTSGDRAPLHHKQLLQNRSNEIVDEERIGIVSRPKDRGDGTFSTWEKCYPKIRGNYTAEYYLHMKNPANEAPKVLFRRHSGHVLDAKGIPIRQSRTQNPLRHIEQYFANDDSSTTSEIDEKGNWAVKLAAAAVEGYQLAIPSGSYIKTVELDETITVRRNHQHSITGSSTNQIGESLRYQIGGDYHLKMNKGQQEFMMSSVEDEEKTSFKTKAHTINIDDTPGAEEISIIHKLGSQFSLDETGSVKMAAKGGANIFFDATTGAITATGGGGDWITIRKDEIVVTTGKSTIVLNDSAVQVTSEKSVLLQAPKVAVQGGAVELGNFASLAVALAEPLAILFDTHLHGTPLGPSSPPIPPFTAALNNANPLTSFASDSVKIKANLT